MDAGCREMQCSSGDAALTSEAAIDFPTELVDELVRLGGWRTWGTLWSKVCKRYHPLEWWLAEGAPCDSRHKVVVTSPQQSINASIAKASSERMAHQRAVVLVRPGTYREAIRMTADVSLCALGPRGSATVHAPGWEPALVWGGYKVGATSMLGVELRAASAGSMSEVMGFRLVQRNQQQQLCVYVTGGSPLVFGCDIAGSVLVAGRAAAPTISHCRIAHSRSAGIDFRDYARGTVESNLIEDNSLAAVRVSASATPTIAPADGRSFARSNVFRGNLVDAIQRFEDDDDEFEIGDGLESDLLTSPTGGVALDGRAGGAASAGKGDAAEHEGDGTLQASTHAEATIAIATDAAVTAINAAADDDEEEGSKGEARSDDGSDGACGVTDELLDFLAEHVGDGPVALGDYSHLVDDDDDDPNKFEPLDWDIAAGQDAEAEAGVGEGESTDWVDSAAASLAHNGFVVLRLPAPLIPPDAAAEVHSACLNRLSHLFGNARARGINPKKDVMRYTEVCARTPGGMRYDMRFFSSNGLAEGGKEAGSSSDGLAAEGAEGADAAVGVDAHESTAHDVDALPALPASWSRLRAAAEAAVRPILSSTRLHGDVEDAAASSPPRTDSVGCVTSLSGAPDQHFHPDGTAVGLFNLFVPLVPVMADNGPTEIRPGSHEWVDTPYGPAPRWDERRQCSVTPLLPRPAQDVLIFDYRVYHRGRANRSLQPRPVAYVAFSTRAGVSDAHNFPSDTSLLAPVPASVAADGEYGAK